MTLLRTECDWILEGGKGEFRQFGKVIPNVFMMLPASQTAMMPLHGASIRAYDELILSALRRLDARALILLGEFWFTEFARKPESVKSVYDLPAAGESPDRKLGIGVVAVYGGPSYLTKSSHIRRTPFSVQFDDDEFAELPHVQDGTAAWLESLLAAK